MKISLTKVFLIAIPVLFYAGKVTSQVQLSEIIKEHNAMRYSDMIKTSRFINNISRDDPLKIEEQRKYDVTFYRLDITVFPDSWTIAGTTHIYAKSGVDNLKDVVLDLNGALTVTSVSGDVISFDHDDVTDILTVNLDKPYSAGSEFEIQINYGGTPELGGFSSFSWLTQPDGNMLISTLSEPYYSRDWWPCKDIPEDKADSAEIIVTVPEEMTAVSNGTLEQAINNGNGTTTFRWMEQYPISTYLISLAISDYDYFVEYYKYSETDSMPVEYYVTPSKSADVFGSYSGFNETIQMLEIFSDLFGLYPFIDEKYSQVEFLWGGGMEHQTATSLSVGIAGPSIYLVAHELAHQWWGDMITCRDWRDLWLNEGFATYCEALYLEFSQSEEAAAGFMLSIDRLSYSSSDFAGRLYRDNITDLWSLFDSTVYDKGGWALYMLRYVVGDSAFFDILKSYGADPDLRFGTAATADFQRVCESVYGSDLEWFFEEWVYGYGRPHYNYFWTTEHSADSFSVQINITQTQLSLYQMLYTMPLEIFIHGVDSTAVFRVNNSQEIELYELSVNFQPVSVTIDDNNRILKSVIDITDSINNDDRTRPIKFVLDQNYPNPFNGSTNISYYLPASAVVRLSVFNILGQEIRVLKFGLQNQGGHFAAWDAKDSNGIQLPTGIYFYRITADNFSDTKKLVVLR